MRDSLITLIKDLAPDMVVNCGDECDKCFHGDCVGKLADHLMENGVVVLPCKVGDTLYEITDGGKITTFTVRSFYHIVRWMEDEVFGFILFTTREEAEKALAEKERKWNLTEIR